ncbi:MAG: fused DSP-PTPase phosphatase/NAD kinase-like protein [Planctomycetota bacterium]
MNDSSSRPALKRRVIIWIVAGGMLVVLGFVIKFGRHHVIPKRFAVVEPGQLYRSGYLQQWPLQRVIDKYDFKTVLCLMNDQPDNPRQQKEDAILKREGINLIRIGMGGDGCADFDLLDRAADIIADNSVRPLLVHCAAGVHRTGASYGAWRMKYCGWSFEKALQEMEKYGYNSKGKPKLREHMREYYRTRIRSNGGPDD